MTYQTMKILKFHPGHKWAVNNKRRAKETFHPLLDGTGREQRQRMRKRIRYLMPSFPISVHFLLQNGFYCIRVSPAFGLIQENLRKIFCGGGGMPGIYQVVLRANLES